ncbi:MAG: cation diffusion facilitator family transporter [Oscillospiraceae bacterium]|nr:cation diffusion facilitator family transporter [Oscillospiraceae bacterium]
MQRANEQIAIRVTRNTLVGNVLLAAFKLIAGILGHSSAMISDAVHSLTDIVSTVVVIVGVKLGNRSSDDDHPYGHERFESAAAIVLSGILLVTGLLIGYNAVMNAIEMISASDYKVLAVPTGLALVAAIVSIAIKEAMYWYTRNAAKKIGSGVLMADAWHQRADGLSSIGSLLGILGARLGFPAADPLAGVIICLFIVKVSLSVFRDAIRKMTDTSCDEATEAEIRAVVLAQENVLGIDKIMTRMFGDRIYVDIEISVDRAASLIEAHDIAEHVHDVIESQFEKVKHCMVHVNPAETTAD